MNEISKYEAQKKKLEGICEENNLTFRFHRDTYPITLTVRPLSGVGVQMSMLENVEEQGYISPDAYLMFVYKDGDISHKMSGTFSISDALFAKLKNIFKKMHYYWLQYFFRNVIERSLLTPETMPAIDEEDACDNDYPLPEGAEPLEELENDEPDEDITKATEIVRMENKASIALLQRRMNISEERAEQIMGALEVMGVVGPYKDDEPREVLPYDEPTDGEDGAEDDE